MTEVLALSVPPEVMDRLQRAAVRDGKTIEAEAGMLLAWSSLQHAPNPPSVGPDAVSWPISKRRWESVGA